MLNSGIQTVVPVLKLSNTALKYFFKIPRFLEVGSFFEGAFELRTAVSSICDR